MPFIPPTTQGQLLSTFNNDMNQPALLAQNVISAIVAGASSVQKVMGVAVIPFAPMGMAGAISLLNSTFSNDMGQPAVLAQQLATAISILDPMIPPVQLATIQSQLMSTFNNENNQPANVAADIANACNTYFMGSGICI